MATEAEERIWEYVIKNMTLDQFRAMQRMFAPVEEEE
jgi:hypothetical protein